MNLSEYRQRVELHAARQGHLLGDWENGGVATCTLCGGTVMMAVACPPGGSIYSGGEGWETEEYPVCGESLEEALLAKIKGMVRRLLSKARASGHTPDVKLDEIEAGTCVECQCDECGAGLFHVHYDGELGHDLTNEKCGDGPDF